MSKPHPEGVAMRIRAAQAAQAAQARLHRTTGPRGRRRTIVLVVGAVTAVVWVSAGPARADGHGSAHPSGGFVEHVLVSDQASTGAPITDPNLINPWGI